MNEPLEHVPVLLGPALEALALRPGGVYLDATVGLGGHSSEILRRTAPDGRLLGLDRDPQALARAAERLAPFGARLRLLHGEFSRLRELLPEVFPEGLDGALLDLGVSSLQLGDPSRGFGFMRDAPLDMRMDPTRGETAQDYLRRVAPEELEERLRTAGETRFARRLARELLRDPEKWRTTGALASALERMLPRRGRTHPATRVFLALRLAVNRELESLEKFLRECPLALKTGGRLVAIAFHSAEDRIVKRSAGDVPGTTCRMAPLLKRPLEPGPEEVRRNPRSRSAKMRVFEKRPISP